ncbi:MAG TPA: LPS-assembly protein LptD [Burkholderiales bacterium]|nr:LPS-assembly protein LptD [Burkholderiales bacterium]
MAKDQPLPTFVDAERIQGRQDEYLEAEGAARVRRHDQSVEADRIRYEQESQELTAEGNVRLERGDGQVTGTRAEYNMETGHGVVENPNYVLAQPAGRGSAAKFSLDGDLQYSARDASYTTCPAGNNDWFLRAEDLRIDRAQDEGVARNALLEFKGVPILYTPYADFPLAEQRKSGLLTPVFGNTSSTGTDIIVPYYWNIAYNMDATIAPRFMSKRGIMLDGEFRYLNRNYNGTLRGDWLGNDKETDTDRWALSIKHSQNFGYGFSGAVDYQRVSDDNFLRDFGNRIALTSITTLPQEGYVSYGGGWWSATARYQTWQTLQDPAAPIVPPYNREPQFLLTASRQNLHGFDAGFAGEYVDFKNSLNTLTTGDRLVLYPSVSYPLLASGGFLVPRASLHYVRYSFANPEDRAGTDRSIPILSLDGGLVFERDWSLGGTSFLQTLEPRVFYVYAPFREQATLPVYDTAEADFNFSQLFSENRFVGNDRVGDANQVTLALTTRLLEPASGAERIRFAVGQRFFLTRPRVFLLRDAPTGDVSEPTKSDFLTALSAKLGTSWLMDAGWQYDPADARTRKSSFGVRYQPGPSQVLNLGYRYTAQQLEQVGGSTQWPLGGGWWGLGVLDYSLQDGRALNAVAGVEYNSTCWSLRVVAQRFATTTAQTNNQFFIQLELRGLGRIGTNPLDLLRQSIPGYTPVTGPAAPIPQ